jgi:hypothetical protein
MVSIDPRDLREAQDRDSESPQTATSPKQRD